jgi:beta-glucanase (GH16 family)
MRTVEQQGLSRRAGWWRAALVPLVVSLAAIGIGLGSVGPDRPTEIAAPAPLRAVAAASADPAEEANGGWGQPWFVEDFSGSTLDTSRWFTYDSPTEEPKRDPSLLRVTGNELQVVGSVNAEGREVGSGLANTFGQMYGRWEVRFRMDKGAGYGPAILLWPDGDGQWPRDGEIDLMEIPKAAREWGTTVAHNGSPDRSRSQRVTADFTQWHTVAVDWLPDLLTFYFDGKKVWTVTPATKPYQGGNRNLVPSTSPMRLALQLDECSHSAPLYGPDWIPCRNKQTPPEVILHIDWVKIYKAP